MSMTRAPKTRKSATPPTRGGTAGGLGYAEVFAPLVAAGVFVLASSGLVVSGADWQLGVMTGLAAGFAAASARVSPWTSAAAVFFAALAIPAWHVDASSAAARPAAAATTATVCAAVAMGVTVAPRQWRRWAGAALVALVIANLWATSWLVSGVTYPERPALRRQLASEPAPFSYTADDQVYLRIFHRLEHADPYYTSVSRAWREHAEWRKDPFGVFSYRLPTLFWVWRALPPGDGSEVLYSLLGFAALAIGSAYAVARRLGAGSAAVLAAPAVGAYYLLPATTPYVLYADYPAMAIGLAAIAAYAEFAARGKRAWLATSIALALSAALVREHMVYLLVAGGVAAVVATRLGKPSAEDRTPARPRHEWAYWAGALAVWAVAVAAHASRASGAIAESSSMDRWLNGGVDHLWATLTFGQLFFRAAPALPVALIAAGAIAAVSYRGPAMRAFLGFAVLAPFAGFLLVGNDGYSSATMTRTGYWGVMAAPTAVALAPVLLGRLRARLASSAAGPAEGTPPRAYASSAK